MHKFRLCTLYLTRSFKIGGGGGLIEVIEKGVYVTQPFLKVASMSPFKNAFIQTDTPTPRITLAKILIEQVLLVTINTKLVAIKNQNVTVPVR